MPVVNNKITAPVSIADVRQVLGESSNDLGTLCKSSHINKFSKHKPVVSNIISPDYKNKTEWEQHFLTYDVNKNPKIYGLDITIHKESDSQNARLMYENGNCSNYVYDTPNGASYNTSGQVVGSPFRLGDFEGYFHLSPQFCTSNFKKDTIEEYVVSKDTSSIDGIMFYVDGSMVDNGNITFSDFKNFTTGNFVLCANCFDHNSDRWLGEYINDSIKLGDYTLTSTLNPEYDDGIDRYKYVTVNFDKTRYWGKTVDVYLTLDWVKYDSAEHVWWAEQKMIIPYSDEHYYKKTIKFTQMDRQVQAYELQTGDDGSQIIWSPMFTPVPNNRPSQFLHPFIHFKISRTNNPLRFYTGQDHRGYWIRTKYIKPDGTTVTRDATTTTRTKTNIPEYIDIQSARTTSEYSILDDLYIQIDNIFGETELNKFLPNVSYPIEIYLCSTATGEVKVGTFSISYK